MDDGVIEVKAYADTMMKEHLKSRRSAPVVCAQGQSGFHRRPEAPTAKIIENSTQLATTAFVQTIAKALSGQPPSGLSTLEKLATALSEKLAKNQNGADIPDKAGFRENLGLMEAALRSVGTGENQLPDMRSFSNSFNVNGFQEFPSGLILQWRQGATTNSDNTIQFPTAFRHQYFQAVGSDVNSGAFAYGFGDYTKSTMKVWSNVNAGVGFRYVAIGY